MRVLFCRKKPNQASGDGDHHGFETDMEHIETDWKFQAMPEEVKKMMDQEVTIVLGVKTQILMHDTQMQMMAAG